MVKELLYPAPFQHPIRRGQGIRVNVVYPFLTTLPENGHDTGKKNNYFRRKTPIHLTDCLNIS
jgi:hypothetical protein